MTPAAPDARTDVATGSTERGLTPVQQREILDDGYTLLPGIVAPDLIDRARRAINASLGERGLDPEQLPTLRARSYCPELASTPEILGLLTESPLWSIAESVIAPGELEPVDHAQIALRFPSPDAPGTVHPHIDGMYSPHNGVPEGSIRNFTALIGVYLSDVATTDAGNFTVWPGSHRLYADYFAREGAEALLQGMPPVELPEPVQTTPRAGDAVLSHYQIGHGIAPNASPNIRYAIYFRLHRRGHDAIRLDVMTDLWREWDGLRGALGIATG